MLMDTDGIREHLPHLLALGRQAQHADGAAARRLKVRRQHR